MTTRVLVPSGVLGLGFGAQALRRGLQARPDIICIDGGSTDSGPFYLGTGESKYSRASTKNEWRELMRARTQLNIPLVITSCGTCGTRTAVDWMLQITRELAAELKQRLRIAVLYSDQDPAQMASAWREGKIQALDGAPPTCAQSIARCANIVALAGVEQIAAALETGADIVLAGRATDTASIAALPIMRGEHRGAAWHAAKIAECGALCTTRPTSGVVLVEVDERGFSVRPGDEGASCTPHTVFAHMLYENTDPFVLYEPGGQLNVAEADYQPLDARTVRVEGSAWIADPAYKVKLEAAAIAGYQTSILAVLREPRYVENALLWTQRLKAFLEPQIEQRMALGVNDYSLEFRLIGVDSTLGDLEREAPLPVEVGVLGLITAADQTTATEIARLINPWVLHYPLTVDEEIPTFAFPYSPAHSERGPLYEFQLNHVLELDDPMDGFELSVQDVDYA